MASVNAKINGQFVKIPNYTSADADQIPYDESRNFREGYIGKEIKDLNSTVATHSQEIVNIKNDLASDYSSSSTYAVGDYCIYNGNMYRCTTEITVAEAWASGHWTQVQVGDELDEIKEDLVNIMQGNDISSYTPYQLYNQAIHGVNKSNWTTTSTSANTGYAPNSEIIIAESPNATVTFDDTSYKIGWVYYDASGNYVGMNNWITTSPSVLPSNAPSNAKSAVVEIRTLNTDTIDWRTIDALCGVTTNKNLLSTKSYVDNKSSIINDKVNGISADVDVLMSRNKVRRLTPYVAPTNFGVSLPFGFAQDGYGNFSTLFDVSSKKNASGTTYYVSLSGRGSGDGLTRETANTRFDNLYGRMVDGDTVVFIDAEGTMLGRGEGLMGSPIQKSINIVAENKVILFAGDRLSWTLDSGVYKATRSAVFTVIDFAFSDEGAEYIKRNSLADCKSQSGSWYTDGSVIYVNPLNNMNKICAVMDVAKSFDITPNDSNVSVYLENITIIGGQMGNLQVRNTSGNSVKVYAKNCKFLYSYGNPDYKNSVNVCGATETIFQNCVSAYARGDGFNYSQLNGVSPLFVEINCIGHDNGVNGLFDTDTHNGSTAHNYCHGIRLGGNYYNNIGPNVADVGHCASICIGLESSYSKSENQNYSVGLETGSTSEMWAYGCTSNNNHYDIVSAGGNSKLHIINSEYDTQHTNDGTIDSDMD